MRLLLLGFGAEGVVGVRFPELLAGLPPRLEPYADDLQILNK